jgi:hypothetical protein
MPRYGAKVSAARVLHRDGFLEAVLERDLHADGDGGHVVEDVLKYDFGVMGAIIRTPAQKIESHRHGMHFYRTHDPLTRSLTIVGRLRSPG